MGLHLNNIYHMDNRQGLSELSEKSVNLIIADPPYFEVKGEFDFVWKSFTEYLDFMEQQAQLYKRVLADNGTIYVYGDAKNIAYVQVIFDRYFNLINNLVWDKGSFMGLEESEELRSYAPCTERILMYGSLAQDLTGLSAVEKEYVAPRNPFAIELRSARIEKGVSINQVAEYGKFYGNVNHGGAVTNWERGYNVPLKEQWEILCQNLPIKRKEYEELRKEYEELRKEYEDKRRPFNNVFKHQEIIRYNNEAANSQKYDHETVKPEKLTRALIQTSSRPNDIVCVPFAGSGTECAMAAKEKRLFVGFETNLDHVMTARKRVAEILSQPELF